MALRRRIPPCDDLDANRRPFTRPLAGLVLSSLAALGAGAQTPTVDPIDELLAPAPPQEIGWNRFDWFGETVTFQDIFLNPQIDRDAVYPVNERRRALGERVFFDEEIGDQLGLQRVLGFSNAVDLLDREITIAIAALQGAGTSNLKLRLLQDITVGGVTFETGSVVSTGLDVAPGSFFPIGIRPDGNITCAVCHAVVNEQTGDVLPGVPNGDLNVRLIVALANNSAGTVGRLSVDVTDPALYDGTGKSVIDSAGNVIELPNPQKIELLAEQQLLAVPPGHFESAIDRVTNTTQIPAVWTRGVGPFAYEGAAAVGPFDGLTVLNNAVHSSEINILAVPFDGALLDIDREVYLGILLQNAADPALRLPEGDPVRPSEFLRQVVPVFEDGELEDQVVSPTSGEYPNVIPTLFTYNGLIWSPNTEGVDLGGGTFLEAANALSVFQDSLDPPPNKTAENEAALADGTVRRGAQVFLDAGCADCHRAPFFVDNRVHPNSLIKANPARAQSRLPLDGLLAPPTLYAFNEPVPIRDGAKVLELPFEDLTDDPSRLPEVVRDGGYKTLTLRGVHVTAPYLHDGGVAVSAQALSVADDGSFLIVDPTGIGLPGTLYVDRPADPANSLRAMVDSGLRQAVIATNAAFIPAEQNLEGRGHEFWVDGSTGFTPAEQAALISFLLALDDNPGEF